jgi:tetratricopeptide (TPR) repeat protein
VAVLRRLAVAFGLVASALVLPAGVKAQGRVQPLPPIPLAPGPTEAARPPQRDWMERLQPWVEAARAHRSGSMDAHVVTAASLSRTRLIAIRDDLKGLSARLVRAHKARRPAERRQIRYGGRTLATEAVQTLLGIDDAEAAAGNINALLRLGAILHTDVAYHSPPVLAEAAGPGTAALLFRDGQQVGYEYSEVHWEFARLLLDLVTPAPSGDPAVHRWYVAAGALMRRQLANAYSAPHLERARDLFPDDALVQMLSGCLHESRASARMQSFLRDLSPRPEGARSPQDELRRAEGFLRRAAEIAPETVEARIRLGHVLGALGKPADGARELGRALQETTEPTLVYFATMFLGDAEQALGHRERAQAAYERAQALFPGAQSVLLALGQLARRFGDRASALAAMERLSALPPLTASRPDPWWAYQQGTVESDEALLDALRGALRAEEHP